jgi:methyl-accepting chemotaxis protein
MQTFMKRIRSSIRLKLLAGFALVLAAALALALFGAAQLADVNGRSAEIAKRWLPAVRAAADMRSDLSQMQMLRLRLLATENNAEVEETMQALEKRAAAIDAQRAALAPLMRSGPERELAGRFDAAWKTYAGMHASLVKMADDYDLAGIKKNIAGPGAEAHRAAVDALKQLIELENAGSRAAAQAATATATRARWLQIGGIGVLVLAGVGIAAALSRRIVFSLRLATEEARSVADGRLGSAASVDGSDEVAEVRQALGVMQQRLREIVAGVRSGAEGVAAASLQIAQGHEDLRRRSAQQAGALQQSAASMTTFAGSMTASAGNAHEAERLAADAARIAQSGGAVVGRVVDTMQGIEESSRRIADIIGVIDGIAFQTNILALNAAVEAARAGEQGRGFAVVASEVRALARRSAEAAQQIKSLIAASSGQVDEGGRLVDEAGGRMREIVEAIGSVSAIVSQIAEASAAQSQSLAQVDGAIAQIEEGTRRDAAFVVQAAAAAESLETGARRLVDAMASFRTA